MRTWIVVAHRAGARILEQPAPGRPLELVEELDNAAGRLRNSEIDADRPGRAFDRFGGGRHAMEREESPHDRAAADFARKLADRVRAGRTDHSYGQVVLVAEPRFLGLLRGALDQPTADLVSGTIAKDLARVEVRDLGPHLSGAVNV
jgi:protein required for attachment to host cells